MSDTVVINTVTDHRIQDILRNYRGTLLSRPLEPYLNT